MDGNRRYAKKQKLLISKGYKDGMKRFLDFLSYQVKYNIYETSFFALSCDNYEKRPDDEKSTLYKLIDYFTKDKSIEDFIISNKFRVEIKGDIDRMIERERSINKDKGTFIENLLEKVNEWNQKNPDFKFVANIALNYDGQNEIVHSFKKIFEKVKSGEINAEDVDEKIIKENLWFSGHEPEIIVRPGDAPRLSGFVLWDSKYSEIYLTHKLWPELDESDFVKILDWYKGIKRNFGK